MATETTRLSERMQKIDAELDALRAVCAILDALPDDAARVRVLAAVICFYDTDAARATVRSWHRNSRHG